VWYPYFFVMVLKFFVGNAHGRSVYVY
jgi:hypothetical protein